MKMVAKSGTRSSGQMVGSRFREQWMQRRAVTGCDTKAIWRNDCGYELSLSPNTTDCCVLIPPNNKCWNHPLGMILISHSCCVVCIVFGQLQKTVANFSLTYTRSIFLSTALEPISCKWLIECQQIAPTCLCKLPVPSCSPITSVLEVFIFNHVDCVMKNYASRLFLPPRRR